MKKTLSLLIALLVPLCLVTACQEQSSAPAKGTLPAAPATAAVSAGGEEGARQTVLRYNQLLSQGYQNLNMNPLQEVTTREQAEKAYHHMAALEEGQSRMISQLKKIDFEKVTPEGDGFRLITREVWDFAYQNLKSKALGREVKGFVYHISYLVKPQQGRLLITDINATGEEPERAPAKPRQIRVGAPEGHPPVPGNR
jgi:hypothetical protein